MDPAGTAPPRREPSAPSPWRKQRDRRRRRLRHRQAAVLLAAYAGLVALVTLTPESVDRGAYPYLMRGVVFLQYHGIPWFHYSMLEEMANVAMFVPLGMLGVLALGRRRWWLIVLAGIALSSSIELAQGALLPHRVASLTDVAANSTGAILGVAAAAVIGAAVRRGRPVP